MPKIRRRSTSRRGDFAELTYGQELHLLHGRHFGAVAPGFGEPESFRAAWKIHRDDFLSIWIPEHPGTRPFAWWFCDHRQERPIISESSNAKATERFYRQSSDSRYDCFGFLHTSGSDFQESERAYLYRNGILTNEEQESLWSRFVSNLTPERMTELEQEEGDVREWFFAG